MKENRKKTCWIVLISWVVAGCNHAPTPEPYPSLSHSDESALISSTLPPIPTRTNGRYPEPDPERVLELSRLLPAEPGSLGRPITDRTYWDRVRMETDSEKVLHEALADLKTPTPILTESDFLEFNSTGRRQPYEGLYALRAKRLARMVLAECMENSGRFLPAIESEIEAILLEPTWVVPGHDRELKAFRGAWENVDLATSMRAWTLALTVYWLGDSLPAPVQNLIRSNLERRVFTPYMESVSKGVPGRLFWLERRNNWNAVCHAGVLGAALTILPSREERAKFLASAEIYLPFFLEGFSAEGFLDEGISYLNYGMGHYVLIAQAVHQQTAGHINWFRHPKVRAVHHFATGIRLADGVYPAFADSSLGDSPAYWILEMIAGHLDLPFEWGGVQWHIGHPLGATPYRPIGQVDFSFNTMKGRPPDTSDNTEDQLRSWFEDGGALVLRMPRRGTEKLLSVAVKGGHNGQNHNQNDLGHFVVAVGTDLVLPDLGRAVYDHRNFTDARYENPVNSSMGHSCPRVDGLLQKTGTQAQAVTISTSFTPEEDIWEIELGSAYDLNQNESLRRRFLFQRTDSGLLWVKDQANFTSPRRLDAAVIAPDQWERLPDPSKGWLVSWNGSTVRLEVQGVGDAEIVLREEPLEGKLHAQLNPTRLVYGFREPVLNGSLELSVKPQ